MTLFLISPLISRCSVDVSSLTPDSTQDVWLDLQEGSGRIHLLLTLSGFSDPAAAYAAQAAAKGGAGDPPEKGPAADGSDLVRISIIFFVKEVVLTLFLDFPEHLRAPSPQGEGCRSALEEDAEGGRRHRTSGSQGQKQLHFSFLEGAQKIFFF